MNTLVRKIMSFFKLCKREYDWFCDSCICRREMSVKNIEIIENKCILILAPHSDDEWVGCSQLLQSNNNIIVLNMDMSGGDSVEFHQERFKEMKAVSEKIGYSLLTVCEDKISFLQDYLENQAVDLIMVPCYFDWHSEHIDVMHMLNDAGKAAGYKNRVAMYQVSLPIPPQLITHGNTMTKEAVKEKWKELKLFYPTQRHLPAKRFLLNERINGALTRTYALEGYAIMEFEDWCNDLERYELSEDKRNYLYDNLQRIRFIRQQLQKHLSN